MSIKTGALRNLALFLATSFAVPPATSYAQTPPAILTIEIENYVEYIEDIADPAKAASTSTLTPGTPLRNFSAVSGLADIVSVNGQPAKGMASWRGHILGFSATPNIEFAISDTGRTSLRHWTLDILKADGTQVGTIQAEGVNGQPPPPGGPVSITTGSYAIVGGTGAFLGVRGQFGQSRTPQSVNARLASMAENPAARRANGGGKIRLVLQLIPMAAPQILNTAGVPAVVHSADFTLVTAAKPAAPGEILSLIATGMGPTVPGVDPGKPFPSSLLANVSAPIEVLVNGTAAELIGAVGYPGAVDGYQVNFRVPSKTASGTAKLQVSSAWMPSPEVSIQVQ